MIVFEVGCIIFIDHRFRKETMPLVTPEIQINTEKKIPPNRIVIEKIPPFKLFTVDTIFFQELKALLFINEELQQAKITNAQQEQLRAQQAKIDQNARSFAGWQLLRLAEDPARFRAKNTGWEQFFAGKPTEWIVTELLRIGKEIIACMRLEFKTAPQRIRLLEKVIRGESHDAWAMKYWTSVFGAVLARQKMELLRNPMANQVHTQAKDKVAVSTVSYVVDSHGNVTQKYDLPKAKLYEQEPDYSSLFKTPDDELAWLIMTRIGMFGDPLFRAVMSSVAHKI